MADKMESLKEEVVIDVGMSIGAGFNALARLDSFTEPSARLILSPVPDPVTPWDNGRFVDYLIRLNNSNAFEAGVDNYLVLQAIREANYQLDSHVPTQVVTEESEAYNSRATIENWARSVGVELSSCEFAHGMFRRGPLPSHTSWAINQLKAQIMPK